MNAEDIRILIGIPCLSEIKTETAVSLITATSQLNYRATLQVKKGCYVHDSRNKLVQKAQEKQATHLMFIDSDMSFPAQAMNRLVEQDKDIIGGIYYRRQPPHYPIITQQREDGSLYIPNEFPTDKSFQVYGIGTGFLLIKMTVFDKLKPPYFYFGAMPDGKQMGEDIYFCNLAKQAGFEIWCDPTLELGHVGEYCYDEKDYQAYQADREKNKEADFDGNL